MQRNINPTSTWHYIHSLIYESKGGRQPHQLLRLDWRTGHGVTWVFSDILWMYKRRQVSLSFVLCNKYQINSFVLILICVTDHWLLWNQNSPVEMTALVAKLPLTVLISYVEISQQKQWQSIDHMVLPAFPNLIWSRELVPVYSDFCWAANEGTSNGSITVELWICPPSLHPPSPFSPPLSEWGQTGWLIRMIVAV